MSQRDKDTPSIQSVLESGDLAGAVALWRQGKARDAGAWKALLALSQACESARQFDLARDIAEDGFRRTPSSSHLKAQIAACTQSLGDAPEALVHFAEALAIAAAKDRALPQEYLTRLQQTVGDLVPRIEAHLARGDWPGAQDLLALVPQGVAGLTPPPALVKARKQAETEANRGAPVDMAALERKTKVAECPHCRAQDRPDTQESLVGFLLDFAQTASGSLGNTTIWKLPSPTGTRFAVAQNLSSVFIKRLRAHAEASGVLCRLRRRSVVPNLYEFDDVDFLPEKAYYLELRWKPHCAAGESYLAERRITLEMVDSRKAEVLVPVAGLGPRLYSHEAIAQLGVDQAQGSVGRDWPFPIDLVYTWVDSSDPAWMRDYAAHVDEIQAKAKLTAVASASRWRSRDELRYSLRSIEMYAPFVRTIYLVTNGQKPRWLKDHPRVRVVSHAELYPDAGVLPSFNSNSIETVLHRIPGLSEHFLYLNDDFFFSGPCTAEDFFSIGGLARLFFSKRYLDARPINPQGRATVACHKTTRDLLEARFGLDCSQKFQHAPHALRRSVWERIEAEFPAEIARTRANRVRASDDLALAMIYGYFALFTGQADKGRIPYGYIEIGTDDIRAAFADLEARKIKVFCLNDCDDAEAVSLADEILIRKMLKARYPRPAAWEVDENAAASGQDKVSSNDPGTLMAEVRRLGVDGAAATYETVLSAQISPAVATKLFRLHLAQDRIEPALMLAATAPWSDEARVQALLDAERLRSESFAAILARQPSLAAPGAAFSWSLAEGLARSVRSRADLEAFDTWLAAAAPRDSAFDSQHVAGVAALSAGEPAEAAARLQAAVDLGAPDRPLRVRAPAPGLAALAVQDLYRLAGDAAEALFLDAGSLRDALRLRRFATASGVVTLATFLPDLIAQLRLALAGDPAFLPLRAATIDDRLEVEHLTGIRIAVTLLHPSEGGWLWSQDGVERPIPPFTPARLQIDDQSVFVPDPADAYLTAIFGARWRSGLHPALPLPAGGACTDPAQARARMLLGAVEALRAGDGALAARHLANLPDPAAA